MALVGAATADRTRRQVADARSGWPATSSTSWPGSPPSRSSAGPGPRRRPSGDITDRYRRATMATLKVAFLSSLDPRAAGHDLGRPRGRGRRAPPAGRAPRLCARRCSCWSSRPRPTCRCAARAPTTTPAPRGWRPPSEVFDVLDAPAPPRGTRTDVPDAARLADPRRRTSRCTYPGRARPALDGFSLELAPGEIVAVAGPSGCGQVHAARGAARLRRRRPGRSVVGDVALDELDPDAWRAQVAWVPQRPHLFAASVADNVRLGRPDATEPSSVPRAVAAAGLDDGRRPAARRARHAARRGRRRPVGRRAPARGPGPGVPARRAARCCSTSPPPTSTGDTEEEVLDGGPPAGRGRTCVWSPTARPSWRGRPGGRRCTTPVPGRDDAATVAAARPRARRRPRPRGARRAAPATLAWPGRRRGWPSPRCSGPGPSPRVDRADRHGGVADLPGRRSTRPSRRWPSPSSSSSSSGCRGGSSATASAWSATTRPSGLLADAPRHVLPAARAARSRGPAGLRRGDLLARLVQDVDSLQDLAAAGRPARS